MIYLVSWTTQEAHERYPTTKYMDHDDQDAALSTAGLLLAQGIAVHIEPVEVQP